MTAEVAVPSGGLMADYKKYDSQATTIVHNARLTEDATVIEGGEKPLVKIKFVLTSRSERHSDLWVEATVQDRQSDLAKYLKKGDTLGVQGFPALRRWGEDNKMVSFELVRAELMPSIELFVSLKERGFEPGAAKGGKKAPPKKPAKKPVRNPEPEDLDDDLEDGN